MAEAPSTKSDPDDLVFLKIRASHDSLKDAKDLKGRTLWVSSRRPDGLLPLQNGHKVDFAKSEGVLLGAEPIVIHDAVEQVAPAKTAYRIPAGDKQVFLIFTKGTNPEQFATAIGYKQAGDYTFLTDQIYFYDDPHKLYSAWGPDVWQGIDTHTARLGMSERQVQMALGQVSTPHGDSMGNRMVNFDDQGHPKNVTFENNKATRIDEVK